MRRIKNPPLNYKKSDQNMIELPTIIYIYIDKRAHTHTHREVERESICIDTFSLYPSEFWITSGAIQNGVPTNVCHC